jgi:ribosomal protein S18 acetylase RimI-like enzyme
MRLEDWREWPPERLTPLFAQQETRWRNELSWDAHNLFELIERSRESGQLPGLVALDDDGGVVGWAYASVQDGLLFIGALHGDRAEVVRVLLDSVLSTPEASYARGYRCFIFPDTPAVAAALTRRRFDVQPFLYLRRPIEPGELPQSPAIRPWLADDLPETARLLARAYAGSADARCFAPNGRLDEWAGYLAQLIRTPACGTWAPGESLVSQAGSPGESPSAVLVATRLASTTTHVAQIAVDPMWRNKGIAAALVNASARLAAADGVTDQTLLVAESNKPARDLYRRLGFLQVSYFLYAERTRISRTTSGVAWTAPDPSNVSV